MQLAQNFCLPVCTAGTPTVATMACGTAVTGIAPRLRVVIADDQLLARELLRRLLVKEDEIELVGIASSGVEAVEAINRLNPDVVLLDVEMPGMDGFSVVDHIRCERKPAIIFVTANKEFALRAFDVQATDYLLKPYTRERLRLALGRAARWTRPD